jgi:hypothetical protein
MFAFLIMALPVASAAYVGAYDVEQTDKYVKSTARCSCSYGSWYTYSTGIFVNYCPGCHHYGTLEWEQNGAGWADYARSDEGMWYCSNCDRDFCAQCGFTHGKYNSGNWLTVYEPEPEPPVVQAVDKKAELINQFKISRFQIT